MSTLKKTEPYLLLLLIITLSLACSTNDPPASGFDSSSKEKVSGRLILASETSTALEIIDLEQGALETSAVTLNASPLLVPSPEGQFLFAVESSANRVSTFKQGTSTSTTSSSTTTTSESDDGHNHGKAISRYQSDDGHDHGSEESESTSSESTTSTTTTSSVDTLSFSITGTTPASIVSKGSWVSIYFEGDSKIHSINEEDLESKIDSVTEDLIKTITSTSPGVNLDDEHIALGGTVAEIEDGTVQHNSTATYTGIVSASRIKSGVAVFGCNEGVLVVCSHSESSTGWEDFIISRPTIEEANIFLAEGEHDHDEEESDEEEDEHDEVIENAIATEWATHDALGHGFAHLTHEEHSAGIFIVEANEEDDSEMELIEGTVSSTVRPVAFEIDNEGKYLIILMSDGSLRKHDASDEGKLIATKSNLFSAITDFHEGEGNLPGLTAGLDKIYIGDPSTQQVHQLDIDTLEVELTWNVGRKPNRLALLGASRKVTSTTSDTHDHD